jgi:hypothetical protein
MHFASLMLRRALRPTLFIIVDLGVSRSSCSCTPAVQILRTADDDLGHAIKPSSSSMSWSPPPPSPPTRPALWAIRLRGRDKSISGCQNSLDVTPMLPDFGPP